MTRVLVGQIGETRILVGQRPFAAIEAPGEATRFVTWPDAPLPDLAATPSIIAAPDALWVVYVEGDGWDDWAPRRSTAVRVDPKSTEVSSIVLDELSPIGADVRGLWVTATTSTNSPNIEDPQQLERSLAGEDVDQPESVQLFRIAPDGSREAFSVDRVVKAVEVVNGHLRFEFYSRGPVIKSNSYSSFEYNYPTARIDVPTDRLPRSLHVADFDPTELGDINWMTEFSASRQVDVDLDFAGVEGVEWTPRSLEPERVAESIRWARDQLEGLGSPSWTWDASGERVEHASPYTEVRVDTVGKWPQTEVVAEFCWRGWGDRVIRHRVRVFDAAGRPALQRYMTVYLEETLATSDPSDHPTVDGAIEVEA